MRGFKCSYCKKMCVFGLKRLVDGEEVCKNCAQNCAQKETRKCRFKSGDAWFSGTFHHWLRNDAGLIEDLDGNMSEIHPLNIRFLNSSDNVKFQCFVCMKMFPLVEGDGKKICKSCFERLVDNCLKIVLEKLLSY